jgi:hypothetical protein
MTTKEVKRVLDFIQYVNDCESDVLSKETLKRYIKEDYFYKKIN